jgi:hypothetical protein
LFVPTQKLTIEKVADTRKTLDVVVDEDIKVGRKQAQNCNCRSFLGGLYWGALHRVMLSSVHFRPRDALVLCAGWRRDSQGQLRKELVAHYDVNRIHL